jgi:hypothetical protein
MTCSRSRGAHGLDFARSEQVIEDEVGVADFGPSSVKIAPAVEKIKNRVRIFGLLIVAGWRIDKVGALIVGETENSTARVEVTMQ